jgi:CRP/FNR family transcriptional regulator, cyclic AMP receptor protein
MDAAAALKASALFESFTDTGIAILASIAVQRSYPAGTPVFVESMLSDSLLVLADGTVTLAMKGPRGDLPMGEVGPGEWLGELSLLTTGQRQCTATATTQVTAFELRHADFQRLMTSKPQACTKLLMAICTTFAQKVVANKDALRALASR